MRRNSHALVDSGRYTRSCPAYRVIEEAWLHIDLYRHVCDLPLEHFGVHLCWCGCAFNDIGEVFTQQPLPLFTERKAA